MTFPWSFTGAVTLALRVSLPETTSRTLRKPKQAKKIAGSLNISLYNGNENCRIVRKPK